MKLRIRISKSNDGCYVATCPALPGCIAQGKTKDQAQENINEAIRGYLCSIADFVPERILDEIVVEV